MPVVPAALGLQRRSPGPLPPCPRVPGPLPPVSPGPFPPCPRAAPGPLSPVSPCSSGPPTSHVPRGEWDLHPGHSLLSFSHAPPTGTGSSCPSWGASQEWWGAGSLFTSTPFPPCRTRRSKGGKGSPLWTPATKPPATGWPTRRCSGARRTMSP